MRKEITISLAVIATFLLSSYLKYGYAYLIFGLEGWKAMDEHVKTNWIVYSQIAIVAVVTSLLMGKSTFSALMMDNKPAWGIGMGILLTLPMWIGYGWLAGGLFNFDLALIYRDIIAAGFREELLFRAFLFGLLFYQAKWGFIPAALLPAIFFGIGHLYQAEDLAGSVNVFLFTALGSVGFSWFLHVTKNFWLLATLHAFMDLAWDLWSVQTDVTGSFWVNVFRFITLGLMVAYCISRNLRDPKLSLRGRLWLNRGN